MPSYFALFAGGIGATIILAVASMVAFVLTGMLEDEPTLTDKVRLGWIIHLLGVCIVVAFYNL